MAGLVTQNPSSAGRIGEDNEHQYVHIQVNEKKTVTLVWGLGNVLNYRNVLEKLKREAICIGKVVRDRKRERVLRLCGNHGIEIARFLVMSGYTDGDHLKVHGF